MHNSIQLIEQEVQQQNQQITNQAPSSHSVPSVSEYQISQEPVLSPGVSQQPIAYQQQVTPMPQSNLVQMATIQTQQAQQVSRQQYMGQQKVHQQINQPGQGVSQIQQMSQNLSQNAVSIQQSQPVQSQPDNITDVHQGVFNQSIITQPSAAQPSLMTRTPSNIGKQHPSQPIQNVTVLPGQRPQIFPQMQSVPRIGQGQQQVNFKRNFLKSLVYLI